MKYILLALLFTNSAFASSNYYFKIGTGKGFSDLNQNDEKIKDEKLLFGGIRADFLNKEWNFSTEVQLHKYEMETELKNAPFKKAKHENENALIKFSPKYILKNGYIGPYVGKYLFKNKIAVGKKMDSLIGVEYDHKLTENALISVGTETNIDSSVNYKMAKISLSYKFHEELEPVKSSPKCEEKIISFYFPFDSAELREVDIESFISRMHKMDRTVVIEGFADDFGSEEYNFSLSNERALNTYVLLKKLGFKVKMMHAYGESKKTGNYTHDRRVDISDCQ